MPLAVTGECDNVVGVFEIDGIGAFTRRPSRAAAIPTFWKAKITQVETKHVHTLIVIHLFRDHQKYEPYHVVLSDFR